MLLDLALLGLGVALLVGGANLFVRGATAIAERFGIRAFVIGLVVVGFGTSTPELAVNLSAAVRGSTDIAVGNVVGSNIANVALILGCTALVRPVAIRFDMVRLELPLMIAAGAGLWLLAADGVVGRVEGALLVAAFGAFLLALLRASGSGADKAAKPAVAIRPPAALWSTGVALFVGLALLMAGGSLCVEAAVGLARAFGLSELVIGLTVVAVGTSLPELAASLAAAWRGHSDLAVGNVVGSCIYNILCVLGLTALIQPLPTTGATLMWLDLPAMIAFSLVLLPMILLAQRISRGSGLLLVLGYAGYLAFLMAHSQGAASLLATGGG